MSKYHQMYRGWKTVSCPKESITHKLVMRNPSTFQLKSVHGRYFQCRDGSLMLNTYKCDNITDCADLSDETRCSPPSKEKLCACSFCYRCLSGQCVFLTHRCDGLMQCSDASDESNCTYVMTIRDDSLTYINKHLQTKRNDSCGDLLMCDLDHSNSCYHQYGWCVYEVLLGVVLYCPELQHLHMCLYYQCPTMFPCLDEYCIPVYMVCDGISDCPQGNVFNLIPIINQIYLVYNIYFV